ncbi:TPA: hypothetical protein H1016_01070 [archaeon]|uniref:Uncharacterized protein n=1 Tax=Candidatus Naiadarchaeum limnaeum TaxID=2756139 RepID=A0A832UUV1_9ARCH|nr:hypothetical protein [Candidatus Naiadarchaeum limnaeum]
MLWVIEHLENLSEWVKLEYAHCSRIIGKRNLLFTNVRAETERSFLRKFGKVEEKSAVELFAKEKIIVLEPRAGKFLAGGDFKKYKNILIGRMLGDFPQRGRTFELLTSKLKNAVPRSLGNYQFSIDGAAFVARKIQLKQEKDLGILNQPEIELSDEHSIELHYAVPVFKGKIIFTPGLVSYLKNEESWE